MPTVLPERHLPERHLPEHDRPEPEARPSLIGRLGWFVGLWAASIAALGVVAYAIKLWIVPS
ncbi:MAG: DUF2474 domain-containing protein [Pseudomonadota bacterium]